MELESEMYDTKPENIILEMNKAALCTMLRAITQAIYEHDSSREVFVGLVGHYSYGADWKSDVFEMRPYYWGDCTCGADDLNDGTECSEDCALMQPNFLHYRTGLTVNWYKYIGRGMEVENMPVDLTTVLIECLADIQELSKPTE
jgi:hypothetical protein